MEMHSFQNDGASWTAADQASPLLKQSTRDHCGCDWRPSPGHSSPILLLQQRTWMSCPVSGLTFGWWKAAQTCCWLLWQVSPVVQGFCVFSWRKVLQTKRAHNKHCFCVFQLMKTNLRRQGVTSLQLCDALSCATVCMQSTSKIVCRSGPSVRNGCFIFLFEH